MSQWTETCFPRAYLASQVTTHEMVKESQRNAVRKTPREKYGDWSETGDACAQLQSRGRERGAVGAAVSDPELRAVHSSRHFYVLFIGVLPLAALYY